MSKCKCTGKIKELKLTLGLKRRIRDYVGSNVYRMNAHTADIYAFSLTTDGEWQGGWDWSHNLVDKYAQWILVLATGEFKRNTTSDSEK